MAKKKAGPAPPSKEDEKLAAIATQYMSDPRVTWGKLFASMGLKVDGKIFAMVSRGHLVVKLPKVRVDELVKSGAATHFDPGHGRLMKEWASITSPRQNWDRLVREAFDFVGGGS
jgi:TfoX/Sxy family transcriptional regulator of competence genes